MKQRIMHKLRGKTGESIAETLIALLISALALIMLAGAIGAASDIITRSNTAVNQHYDADATRVNSTSKPDSPLISALESSYPTSTTPPDLGD